MSRNPKHSKHRQRKNTENKGLIARITRKRLALVIGSMIAILAVLLFKIGDIFWPAWLFDLRAPLMALTAFLILFLLFAAPVIVGFSSDPRPLSGPGDYWIDAGPHSDSFFDSGGGDAGGDGDGE